MRIDRIVHVVGCHAEGEVGDVIVGGVLPPPGDSIWEQSRFIASDGSLRDFVLNEPRGGIFRHVNLLVPPKDPRASMGYIIMEPADTPPMSGSNTICVATVLLETGIIPMVEPVTTLVLEAPAGLVEVTAQCRDGKVTSAEFRNMPSFAAQLDASLEVEGWGTVRADVAFGGDSFVIVDAERFGFQIVPGEAKALTELGMRITAAAQEQLGFQHPDLPDWDHISFALFAGPVVEADGGLASKHAVAIRPGKIDRSPTGTGCSARMAVLHARGLLSRGGVFSGSSMLGSTFRCVVAEETTLSDGRRAIIPSVSGQAWITGTHQLTLDPSDPHPSGYRLGDTWPMNGD